MKRTGARRVIVLSGEAMRVETVEAVAFGNATVSISAEARSRMKRSRSVVETALESGEARYGINTGFGSLSKQRIADEMLSELQHNLVRSHSAGVGAELGASTVRAMMVLLAASLARGLSGVREEVVEALVGMLNGGVTPVVPSVGSVGASGDLAPLAHVARVMIGEGEARVGSSGPMAARRAMEKAGVKPVTLGAKEGLALINGTHLMAAHAALGCGAFERLFSGAVAAAAMSMDACRATDAFLDERVYRARGHPGPARVARAMAGLLKGSTVVTSHKENDSRVQDPYSLRCAPVVLGAAWDAAGYVREATERELGAVTDNPLVFPEAKRAASGKRKRHNIGENGDIVSAGNFHGMPVAVPLDVMAVAVAHVAGISERRTFWLLAATESESGLRPYLAPKPGLHSGLMIAQYTAAACCNRIALLASPASVVNIPTSAGIEDYNSFGPAAGEKAEKAIELARTVVAIELMCAAQGLEAQRPLRSGKGVERVFALVRSKVKKLAADRALSEDIAALGELVESGAFGFAWDSGGRH